jgi:hypothetical protein
VAAVAELQVVHASRSGLLQAVAMLATRRVPPDGEVKHLHCPVPETTTITQLCGGKEHAGQNPQGSGLAASAAGCSAPVCSRLADSPCTRLDACLASLVTAQAEARAIAAGPRGHGAQCRRYERWAFKFGRSVRSGRARKVTASPGYAAADTITARRRRQSRVLGHQHHRRRFRPDS